MTTLTVIIVTEAKQDLLLKCLESLLPGVEEWQLVIVANGETLSPEIVTKARSLTSTFTLIQSPDIVTTAKARNLALEQTDSPWILFLDQKSYTLPGYWELAQVIMKEHKVDAFGGTDSMAREMNAFATSMSLALSSPFCTGTTFGRHKSLGNKLLYADEEKLSGRHFWVKKESIDGMTFPETFQDSSEVVFFQNMKKDRKTLYYHPKLKVAYHRPESLKGLWLGSFQRGFYRSRVLKEKIKKGNEAFWLPPFFVLLHILFFLDPVSFWYLTRMYVSIILFVSIALSMQIRRFWLFPIISFLHYFIVFVYGVGFLCERLGKRNA